MPSPTIAEADIRANLRDYLVGNAGTPIAGELDPDENLLEAGILDSLGIAEITEHMEVAFDIVIDEDEVSARHYRSLNTLTAFCVAKAASRASAA